MSYDMSPTDYHAPSNPAPVNVRKMSTKELRNFIAHTDDEDLAYAALDELDMRAQEAHERNGGMGGWR
jgi:hypothetical protein